jgi:aerobic-type carbon monoxide dehydrogenase small subunit (CoxS/CutS family)
MSAVSLLTKNPRPTRQEARRHMAGNLCRCGSYEEVLDAVMAVAESL